MYTQQLTVVVCFNFPYLFDQLGKALLEQSPDFKNNTFFSKLPPFFNSLTGINNTLQYIVNDYLFSYFSSFSYFCYYLVLCSVYSFYIFSEVRLFDC